MVLNHNNRKLTHFPLKTVLFLLPMQITISANNKPDCPSAEDKDNLCKVQGKREERKS